MESSSSRVSQFSREDATPAKQFISKRALAQLGLNAFIKRAPRLLLASGEFRQPVVGILDLIGMISNEWKNGSMLLPTVHQARRKHLAFAAEAPASHVSFPSVR